MNPIGSRITNYLRRRFHAYHLIRNFTLVLAIVLLYGIIFIPLHSYWGEAVSFLAIIPVALSGWFFGSLIGIFASVFITSFNILLWAQAGVLDYQAFFIFWMVINLVTDGLIGYLVGRVSEQRISSQTRIKGTRDDTLSSWSATKIGDEEVSLSSVIDAIPNPALAVNQHNQVVAWNSAMEKLTGIPAKQLLGLKTNQAAMTAFGENHSLLADFILNKSRNLENELPGARWVNTSLRLVTFLPDFKPGGAYLSFVSHPIYDLDGIQVGAVEFIQDVTESRLEEEQNSIWEQKERITGLFNADYFEKEISRLERLGNFPHSIILLRLKSKEALNSPPTEENEYLLKRVANTIQSAFRFNDVIAYLGERDFAVMIPKTDAGTVENLAVRLRKSLGAQNTRRQEPPMLFSVVAVTSLEAGTLLETFQQGCKLLDEE
jgi:GGDEF domain-containing protein/PAS domain-containing protein